MEKLFANICLIAFIIVLYNVPYHIIQENKPPSKHAGDA